MTSSGRTSTSGWCAGSWTLQGRLESLWQQAEVIARARYQVGEVPAVRPAPLPAGADAAPAAAARRWSPASARRCTSVNRLRVHLLDEPVDTPVPAHRGAPGAAPRARGAGGRRRGAQPGPGAGRAERGRRRGPGEERLPRAVARPVGQRGDHAPGSDSSRCGRRAWACRSPSTGGTRARARSRRPSRCARAEQQGAESVRQLLALRTRERHTALAAVLEALEVYRHGLLSSPTRPCGPPCSSTGWARCPSPRCWR